MDTPDQNRLSDVHRTFDMSGASAADGIDRALPGSSRTHRLKVFKSGNSLALRLPKALGLEAGMEMELLSGADGEYSLKRADAPKRKIDISGFAGKAPWLKPLPREFKEFEERPSTIAKRKAAGLE
jgi:antitoxin VapB